MPQDIPLRLLNRNGFSDAEPVMSGVRRFNVIPKREAGERWRRDKGLRGRGLRKASSRMGRELTGGPEGLPPVSSGPVAVGAHVSVAPPDPEQHCYVQEP